MCRLEKNTTKHGKRVQNSNKMGLNYLVGNKLFFCYSTNVVQNKMYLFRKIAHWVLYNYLIDIGIEMVHFLTRSWLCKA